MGAVRLQPPAPLRLRQCGQRENGFLAAEDLADRLLERKQAEAFIAEVEVDEPETAADLRVELVELG
jgi:hypothetical protein